MQHQLREILDDPENAKWIAWLPHGRAFVITHKWEFAADVLPKYYNKLAKYSSFTRKLNRWGFVRVSRGPEIGAYYHPLVQQNEGRLVQQMTCFPSTSRSRNDTGTSAKRTHADSAPGCTAEASEPSPPSEIDPTRFHTSYRYASYHYQHLNAGAPMDHPSQQPSYGIYGYGPACGMPPPNMNGSYWPYNYSYSSTMYPPPQHEYGGRATSALYSMSTPSHVMEGYGSYDRQYNSSMWHRNVDLQQPYQNPPNYHGNDAQDTTVSTNEHEYCHVDDTVRRSPSSFRLARKDKPESPFYPPFASGNTEGPYHYPTKEDERLEDGGVVSSSLSIDDTVAPGGYCEAGEEETLWTARWGR
jgi:HSF-type DNA-binding